MPAQLSTTPIEHYIPVDRAKLFSREIGQGQPILILHGGPDFDHGYLLPDLDKLSDSFRLIYYDQRGRGRSAEGVQPEDVSLRSEMSDIQQVIEYLDLDSVTLLGHSWGAVLAMEYATRSPDRISHLILMNTAPASQADYKLLRQERRRKTPADIEELKTRATGEKYKAGDPDTVAEYYRVHFRSTVRQANHLEQVIQNLRASFTTEGILRAREIEKRLMSETWFLDGYDLPPRFRQIDIPTLILHGDYDFVPRECAEHVAQAIPNSRYVLLNECGHFCYIEHLDIVHQEIDDFLIKRLPRSSQPTQ